jgi:hypothetical protein
MTLSADFQDGVSGGGTFKDGALKSTANLSGTTTTATVGFVEGKLADDILRAVIYMGLDEIPDGAIVTSGILTLVATLTAGSGALNYEAYRGSESDWTESSSFPTWSAKDGSNNWSAAGGSITGAAIDLGAMPSSTGAITLDITALARDAVDNRGKVLNMVLKGSAETGSTFASLTFKTGDNGTTADRPKLTVKYVAGGGASAKTRSASHPGLGSGRGKKRKRLFRQ